jgi:cysteinyl-tRNA synthetase
VQPFATDHIAQMIAMISALLEKGHAYEAEGNVLFHVPSFKEYGRLSGRNRDEQVAGARVDVAPYKKDAADFVLWKPSAAEQPGWDSPWGRGRPGWHIECSAMSKEYLGDVFDIHGGGIDLTFPHHENEQAQSCCASGRDEFARYWVHNGFVTVEGEKMSKSLGNVLLVHDLLKEYDGEALRLNLLSAHYRQPLDWTKNGLESCQNILIKFYQALSEIEGYATYDALSGEIAEDVMDALLDDMNTPMAMAALHRMFKAFNESAESAQKKEMAFRIKSTAYLMGVLQDDPKAWLARNLERESGDLDEGKVISCIQKRAEARKAKDFATADEMRDALSAMGVEIKDGPEGTEWLVGGIVKGRV